MLKSEDVLRRTHARAAVEDGLIGGRVAEQGGKAQPEFFLGAQRAIGVEVVGVGGADRAGDVTRNRIDRFVFAAIAFGGA